MRRRGRTDGNHSLIVKTLRELGCSVQSLAEIGDGCPDILVGRLGQNWVFEVKDPMKSASRRKLTDPESDWHGNWRGQVNIIEGTDQALAIMGKP